MEGQTKVKKSFRIRNIFSSLCSALGKLINEKSHTHNTNIQFSMDLELVLVDLWSNRTMHTRWTIFPTIIPNTIDTLETMCYFKLIYGSFMYFGPLMVAIDSIYIYKRKTFSLHSSSSILSDAYSRQQCNSVVNNEHLFKSCWHCNFNIRTNDLCVWVPHEIESVLYLSLLFFRHWCCSIVHFNWIYF